jgi:hypothetical protein
MLWVCAIDVDQSITQFRNVQFEFPCCVKELVIRMMNVFNLDGQCIQSVLWDSGTKTNIPFDLMITMTPLERSLLKWPQSQQEVSIECPILLYSQLRSFTVPTVDEFFQSAAKLVPTQPTNFNPLSLSVKPSFFDTIPGDTPAQTTKSTNSMTIQPPPVLTIDSVKEDVLSGERAKGRICPFDAPVIPVMPFDRLSTNVVPQLLPTKPDFSKPEFRFF